MAEGKRRHLPGRARVADRRGRSRASTTGPATTPPSRELARNGIDPLVTVVGTPAAYAEVDHRPADRRPGDVRRLGRLPRGGGGALRARRRVLGAARGETDPSVEPRPPVAWEIWNEPNTALFWTPAPDADAYAALLKRSGEGDPEGRSRGPDHGRRHVRDPAVGRRDRLLRLHRPALRQQRRSPTSIDIVAIHPYSPDVGGVIDQLDGTREAIDDAGDDAVDLDHRDGLVLGSRRAGRSGEDAGAAGEPAAQELHEDVRAARRMVARRRHLVHAGATTRGRSASASGASSPASSTPTATRSRPGRPSPR